MQWTGSSLAEVVETGRALGASALGAPFGLHHVGLNSSRMSFVAGVWPAFGGAPCHRHMPLSKQRRLAKDMGLRDGEEKGPVIAVDGPAASGKGTIARALAGHFGLPHMDTGLLYRAVALNLWRWGGDPGKRVRGAAGLRRSRLRSCRRGTAKRAGFEDRLDDFGLSVGSRGAC